jgi:phenylacetate-CoA ligase
MRWLLLAVLVVLGWIRWVLERRPGSYVLLMLPQAQQLLETIARLRVRYLFLKARAECPGYRRFLADQGYAPKGGWRLEDVPITTKDNYIKRYSIEERCFGGGMQGRGDVIDESSGSSGIPNNWVRNANERKDVRRILQLTYGLIYGDRHRILLNCFALGPWATGMNVSMSLADVGILKSIGPDASKLEATLSTFGTGYRYVVFGYPPFVKSFVDATGLNLADYHLDLIVGGEGISEPLRAYLRKHFRSVVSSYGASDLEINLAVETDWTIALRARCAGDRELCRALFGRDVPPMIFQYNPLDYRIETSPEGELVYTILRAEGAAPKIRYNLRDLGGTFRFRSLARLLEGRGILPAELAHRFGHFPILYVFGRSDLTAAFFGAKVYPADFEFLILEHPALAPAVQSFQFASYEDAAMNRRLAIDLELAPDASAETLGLTTEALREAFHRGLAKSNQDFREVTRMFGPDALDVTLHPAGTGPFAGADIRLKKQYLRRG